MTVTTLNITSGPYTGNGASDEYSYTFRVKDKTQLSVYETDTNGVQTLLTVDTDYTVNNVGADTGGTITRLAGNLPSGYTWYIRSNYIENQLTEFASQGGFFPEVHENQMDHLTFLIQQLRDTLGRQIALSDAIDVDGVLTIAKDAAARAGLFLAFDANGDITLTPGTGTDAGLRTELVNGSFALRDWYTETAASYVSSTTFNVSDATEFHVGRRVKTSEGAYGVITDVSGTTITVELSSGSLTAALASVQLGSAADSTSASVQYYPLKSGETNVINLTFSYENVLRYIPKRYHEAIAGYTITTDLSAYIANAIASVRTAHVNELYFPGGIYPWNTKITINGGNRLHFNMPTGAKLVTTVDNDYFLELLNCNYCVFEIRASVGGVNGSGIHVNQSGAANSLYNQIKIYDLTGPGRSATKPATPSDGTVGVKFQDPTSGWANYFNKIERPRVSAFDTGFWFEGQANANILEYPQLDAFWYGMYIESDENNITGGFGNGAQGTSSSELVENIHLGSATWQAIYNQIVGWASETGANSRNINTENGSQNTIIVTSNNAHGDIYSDTDVVIVNGRVLSKTGARFNKINTADVSSDLTLQRNSQAKMVIQGDLIRANLAGFYPMLQTSSTTEQLTHTFTFDYQLFDPGGVYNISHMFKVVFHGIKSDGTNPTVGEYIVYGKHNNGAISLIDTVAIVNVNVSSVSITGTDVVSGTGTSTMTLTITLTAASPISGLSVSALRTRSTTPDSLLS